MSRFDTLAARFPEEPTKSDPRTVVPYTRQGNTLYISGQVAFRGAGAPLVGKVGAGVTTEQATEEAARCAANALHHVQQGFGSLEVIAQILKVVVFVNAVDDYTDQPIVGHGASDLLVDVLGAAGMHARAALGVASLPLGVPVEVEMVLELTGEV